MANAKTVRSTIRAHHRLRHEHRELQEEVKGLREQNRELLQLNDQLGREGAIFKARIFALEQDHQFAETRYRYIVQEIIVPYAQDNDKRYDESDADTMNAILHPLVWDAMQARPLRGKVKTLQEKLQASKSAAEALRDQAQVWERKSHALQDEAHILREQGQALQAQLQNPQDQLQQSQRQARALQEQVRALQEQAQASKEQVHILQKEMLARVEKVEAVSDEQFAQTFRTLIAAVKSLSRSVRFNHDVDIFGVLNTGALLINVQEHHWKPRAHHKYYVEAWTWSLLLETVFANPWSIYGEDVSVLADNWAYLFGETRFGGWPSPSTLCEKNRCTMTEQLVKHVGEQTITTGLVSEADWIQLSARDQELIGRVLENRKKVANVIKTRLATVSSAMDVAQISIIIDKAFALALQLSLQKCRLQVTYPAVSARYEEGQMSSMPSLDGDDIDNGYVAFIVNPGLTKWGDANGNNLDQRYDIVPALVQLEDAVDEDDFKYGFDARKQLC